MRPSSPIVGLFVLGLLQILVSSLASASQGRDGAPASLRLYVLDCGHLSLDAAAMDLFEDSGAYAGRPGRLFVPCFLVRHPHGDLIWDAGLGDHLVDRGPVTVSEGITATVPIGLVPQLASLGLAPEDIDYVAFSHHHFDHTGNAPLFRKATFLLSRRETDWSFAEPAPFGVGVDGLDPSGHAATHMIDLDHDVFGDGSVSILRTPGHTPGHQVLMLHLPTTGTVILSGDLYHTRENFRFSRLPRFNDSRAETLASFDRVRRLMERHGARLVIQHDPEDIAALPALPAYLD